MKTHLFVVSDLHLGGEPGPDGAPGFQMCPARNQQRLADFISQLPKAGPGEETRLVLAGDVVDFLAEQHFSTFTQDQEAAAAKLQSIIGRTRVVWDALASFVAARGYLTVMLGNHDVELCLPEVRRLLLRTLGEGRVEFLYDNEAFAFGPVLVEHGNRYDAWNAVPHAALRRLRSELSRRLPGPAFPAMPGSQMVIEIMNELKTDYSWVDLLKPETSVTLPILAALGAGNLTRIWKAFRKYQQSQAVDYGAGGEPVDPEYIAAAADRDQAMWDLAQEIAAGGSAEQIGAVTDALRGARAAVSSKVRELRRASLRKALRATARQYQLTFDATREIDTYLKPAKASAERGFEVIVYGHTHLAKNIEFRTSAGRTARYLNTGTWADLMRMPDAVFSENDEASSKALDAFVADLEQDDVRRWRCLIPTFAQIELDAQVVERAEVRFADEGGSQLVTTEGILSRLAESGSRHG
jgi:UDP-2,3-diacylglucosamine pyrophosphatase LpxH